MTKNAQSLEAAISQYIFFQKHFMQSDVEHKYLLSSTLWTFQTFILKTLKNNMMKSSFDVDQISWLNIDFKWVSDRQGKTLPGFSQFPHFLSEAENLSSLD